MNMPFNPELVKPLVAVLSPAERLAETICIIDLKATDDTVTAVIEFDSGYKIDVKANLSDDHGQPYVDCVMGYIPTSAEPESWDAHLVSIDLGGKVSGIALAIERKLASDHKGRSVSAEEAFGGAL